MWLKATVCVVIAAATAMSLLALRQKRIDLMHEMAEHHSQMRQSRQDLWQLQVEIADRLKPQQLQQSVERTGLVLEPVIPLKDDGRPNRTLVRGAGHE